MPPKRLFRVGVNQPLNADATCGMVLACILLVDVMEPESGLASHRGSIVTTGIGAEAAGIRHRISHQRVPTPRQEAALNRERATTQGRYDDQDSVCGELDVLYCLSG